MQRLWSQRNNPSKGFSLIELAVVLIVIAVIAAIAIPTFAKVIDNAHERSALATQQAVARDVAVLIAQGETPGDALTIALAEVPVAASSGVFAAESWTVTESTQNNPGSAVGAGEVSWAADSSYLAWAAGRTATSSSMCRMTITGQDGSCWTTSVAQNNVGAVGVTALAGPPPGIDDVPVTTTTTTTTTTSTTTTTVPAPAAPGNVVATAGDGSVSVTWADSPGATSYTVYRNTSNDFGSATSLGQALSPKGVSGLTNGTQYWFWVVATGVGGDSGAGGPASATPVAAGMFLRVKSGAIQSSSTGSVWTNIAHQPNISGGVGWVDVTGSTIVVGSTQVSTNTKISTDGGNTWTETGISQGGGSGGHRAGVVSFGGRKIAWSPESQYVKTSTTGWDYASWGWSAGGGGTLRGAATNGSTAVVVAESNMYYITANGSYGAVPLAYTGFSAVGWDGSKFVAVPRNTGNWKSSSDGVTWTALSKTTSSMDAGSIEGAGGTFIAYKDNTLMRSTNSGTSWSNISGVGYLYNCANTDITTNGTGSWVIGCDSYSYYSTNDGVSWTFMPIEAGVTPSVAWFAG